MKKIIGSDMNEHKITKAYLQQIFLLNFLKKIKKIILIAKKPIKKILTNISVKYFDINKNSKQFFNDPLLKTAVENIIEQAINVLNNLLSTSLQSYLKCSEPIRMKIINANKGKISQKIKLNKNAIK